MKHFGDITKIDGHKVPIVDIVCGGSPCQDLSVAGKRAGLDGERSGLFMEQIRIVKEMRDECVRQLRMRGADVDVRLIRPRFLVWENVPGAFSSNKGEDFRVVLEEICRVKDKDATVPRPEKWSSSGCIMGDGYSVAWRLHNSQFWGVAQRRRRIALVADFGGSSAPEILFERKGLSGDIDESAEERKAAAPDIRGSIEEPGAYTLKIRGGIERDCYGKKAGKGALVQTELSATLGVSQDQTLIQKAWDGSDISPTLTAHNANGSQRMPDKENFNAVITYGLDRASFNQGKNAKYDFAVEEELAPTVLAKGPGGVMAHG